MWESPQSSAESEESLQQSLCLFTKLQPTAATNLQIIRHKIAQKLNYPFSLRLTARDLCRFCQECPDDNPRHVYIGSYCYILIEVGRKAEKY